MDPAPAAAIHGEGGAVIGLTVHVNYGAGNQVVPVDLVHVETRTSTTHTIRDGTSATMPCEPGTYLVHTVTPEGVILSQQIEVSAGVEADVVLGEESSAVEIKVVPSEHPTAGYEGGFADRRLVFSGADGASGADWGGPKSDGPESDDPESDDPESDGAESAQPGDTYQFREGPHQPGNFRLWACLWGFRRGTGGWKPTPWPDDVEIGLRGRQADLRLKLEPNVLHALSVGGPAEPCTVVVLPPNPVITATLRRGVDSGLVVGAHTHNEGAESVLAYLTHGQLAAASALAGRVLDEAEKQLYNKVEDPLGAVVGGLFLARTRNLKRLHNWPAFLADLFP